MEKLPTTTCAVEGCLKAPWCRGWCTMHYARWKNTGDPGPVDSMIVRIDKTKLCKHCDYVVHNMARQLCLRHYRAFRVHGDPLKVKRYGRNRREKCHLEGCPKQSYADGWCKAHYEQTRLGKDPHLVKPRAPKGTRMHIATNKYRKIWKPGHPNADSTGWCMEHRFIMAEALGRPLEAHETPHHKNGNRTDNRLVKGHELHCEGTCCNLELWSKHQPAGQRAVDKIAYALEILTLYAPERLAPTT